MTYILRDPLEHEWGRNMTLLDQWTDEQGLRTKRPCSRIDSWQFEASFPSIRKRNQRVDRSQYYRLGLGRKVGSHLLASHFSTRGQ